MSLPGTAILRALTADGRVDLVLARDVRKGNVLVNPYGRPGHVACVIKSIAQLPFVGGNLTLTQALHCCSIPTRTQHASRECMDRNLKGVDRYDVVIANPHDAFFVANDLPSVAWDPAFVLNATMQRLPGYNDGLVDFSLEHVRAIHAALLVRHHNALWCA